MDSVEALGSKYFKNPELANKVPAGLRTLTVEEELPDNTAISSYEQVSAIIDRVAYSRSATATAVTPNKLTGSPAR